jgi:hypothetical protein
LHSRLSVPAASTGLIRLEHEHGLQSPAVPEAVILVPQSEGNVLPAFRWVFSDVI